MVLGRREGHGQSLSFSSDDTESLIVRLESQLEWLRQNRISHDAAPTIEELQRIVDEIRAALRGD